jgi:hypothetical protein
VKNNIDIIQKKDFIIVAILVFYEYNLITEIDSVSALKTIEKEKQP